jgi:DNA-binding response OmpR family regulator
MRRRRRIKGMAQILLIEDNSHIMKMNADELSDRGYEVLCADNLAQARNLLQFHQPDLIILDILLPDGNGIEFCRELRESISIPVIFLSAMAEDKDVVEGLQAGGEDYLTKPYNLDVLAARVEVQLRHSSISSSIVMLGPIKMDTIAMICWLDGKDILLTKKEFAVLLLLIKQRNKMIPSEKIYNAVWGQDMQDNSQALRTIISRLNRKLPSEQSQISISYIRNQGYILEQVNTK